MAVTIALPHVGESVVEGVIGRWLVQPGDRLRRFDPLVEVVTDKVTMEVPCPQDGVLTRVLAQEGETVPMGAPIAELDTGEPGSTPNQPGVASNQPAASLLQPAATTNQPAVPASPPRSAPPRDTIGYLSRDLQPVGPTGGVMSGPVAPSNEKAENPPAIQEQPASPQSPPQEQAEDASTRRRYSPAVRRLAQEHSLDIDTLTGTGMGGRVTRDDVMRAVEARTEDATAPSTAPIAPPAAPLKVDEEAIPLTPVRRIIAEHMSRSASQIPHAWGMIEVDVNSLVAHRERVKDEFRQREGVSLTYLPFVIKALVETLKENPRLNSSWGGDKIILKKRINIGVAVAAPDGLVVPVVHDADSASIAGLARTLQGLTDRARQGKLSLDEVQGGTFTINNTGALGSLVSQPIINHPQAAILTTEAIQKRAVVVNDAIAIRSMMNLCLSFDHRVIDGAESGAFLQALKRRLEAMGPDTPIY